MDWIERLNRDVTGRLPLLIGSEMCPVEVLHWAYSAALPDNVPHRHTFFEVCLVGRYGKGVFRVLNQEYPLSAGDLFIARPGVLHQIRNAPGPLMELSWVTFATPPSLPKTNSLLAPLTESTDILVIPERTHSLTASWNTALSAIAGNSEVSSVSVAALAAALLTGIIQSGSGEHSAHSQSNESPMTPTERLARIAVRYIHDNLNRPISVAEVAAQIHVSPRHLTRLMESFVGVAPASYIERARMDRAATLLARSPMPIKEIAGAVGYGTIHHFTRAFTRVHGMPPGAFRKEGGFPIRRHSDSEAEGALV